MLYVSCFKIWSVFQSGLVHCVKCKNIIYFGYQLQFSYKYKNIYKIRFLMFEIQYFSK